jgi:hypothetical protein
LAGLVFVVLIILGTVLVGSFDYLPPADEIVDLLSNNSLRVSAGGYFGGISAFFLIWFAGSVRSALREREGGTERLTSLAFGGGVASGVSVATVFAIMLIAAQRAGAPGGIGTDGAVALFDLWSGLGGLVIPVAFAVFVGATAVATLRTAVLPAWFGWLSAVVALGLLSPVGYLFAVLALAWVVVVSLWLYARGR